jgi:hypothetical protein
MERKSASASELEMERLDDVKSPNPKVAGGRCTSQHLTEVKGPVRRDYYFEPQLLGWITGALPLPSFAYQSLTDLIW